MKDKGYKKFRERLLDRELLIGTIISLPVPELAAAACRAGFDWLFLDMEHGTIGLEDLNGIFDALPPECAGVVRVPENGEMWIKKALDAGASGIIVPHTNTAKEAALAARWCRYAPAGERSLGFTRANRFGDLLPGYLESANRETVYIPQIEHIEAVRNIEAIVDVPGVDAVFVGPFDLSASLGLPGKTEAPEVLRAIGAVKEACLRKNLPAGIFCRNGIAAEKAIGEGFTLVCVGLDVLMFKSAAEETVKKLRREY